MRHFSPIISRYVFQAVLPYFFVTWLLLSVILFVQQAGRFSDLLFSAAIPNNLVWQLTLALIPNVIAFTCPVAALVGTIIGLSRMQGDSETIALRAAGVGNVQISVSIVILGVLLSFFALFINMKGVPFAAQIVRRVALQSALYKLESPIEPGTFNTEIEGLTVYVKDSDREKGVWQNIFIFQENKENGEARLITAIEGRIDSKGENSEIVLNDAAVSTFGNSENNTIASENVNELRFVVQTKRGEIVKKLSQTRSTPEEMGLSELGQHIATLDGRERTDAQILWQRRILLSITPFIFALLGAGLVSKFNRGGRGFGVFLALVSLVIYYLLALLGEQLARTGAITAFTAALIPLLSSGVVIFWLFGSQRFFISRGLPFSLKAVAERIGNFESRSNKLSPKSSYIDLTTGILDLDLIWGLFKNYILTIGFLTAIYMIFTAFELWKYAGTIDNGILLLLGYLFFLIPFIYIEIAPSALMIATLATYIIKSRQNEIVTWAAAGQSIYRLLLPCYLLMIVVGIMNLGIQEWIVTGTNRKQDALRDQIRGRNTIVSQKGVHWVASDNQIYSFEKMPASDNEHKITHLLHLQLNPTTFRIEILTKATTAIWQNKELQVSGDVNKYQWIGGKPTRVQPPFPKTVPIESNPFGRTITKPSHLTIKETRQKVESTRSSKDQRTYQIALHKKYSTPFLPFIITLFTAPFALSLSRKGRVVTLGYAIAIWLLFMGITNAFQEFGTSGYLLPSLSVWGPLVIFTVVGIYLLTRIRT